MKSRLEKGGQPGEAACIEGQIQYEQPQGAQAEGDAYAAVRIHGDDYPVYEPGVADDAGAETHKEIAAASALFQGKEEGNERDVGEERRKRRAAGRG